MELDKGRILEGMNAFLAKIDVLGRFAREDTRTGLDIGSFSAKFVILKRGSEGTSAAACGTAEIPGKDGKQRETAVREAVAALRKEKGLPAGGVYLTLSDPEIHVKGISVPSISEEEISKAIIWQVEKHVPFSVEEAVVDYQMSDLCCTAGEDHVEVIFAAARKKTIFRYAEILRKEGLELLGVDVSPFSSARILPGSYQAEEGEMAAIIDIGHGRTDVIVLDDSSFHCLRTIDSGGKHLTEAISAAAGVGYQEAEALKRNSVIPVKVAPKGQELSCIRDILDNMARDIDRAFAYCESRRINRRVGKIVLAGGGALMRGLPEYLGEKLGGVVTVADPLKGLSGPGAEKGRGSPELAAALGAALW